MKAERFQQVMSLFDRACELEARERTAFLDQRCADDPDLRGDVEALLSADARPSKPVSEIGGGAMLLAAEIFGTSLSPSHVTHEYPPIPTLAGHYRILRVIGEGGMGIVYEAQQATPRRTVALKAIRPGLLSPQALQRFWNEIDILGRLQHPGIAQIYEAGAADAGRPDQAYFAMEFVRGEPLTDYVSHRRLPTRQRIELLIKVCEAVQHAHQRGVIHRDLKPANILVTEGIEGLRESGNKGASDAALRPSIPQSLSPSIPQPKILDFGVARLCDDSHSALTRTRAGELLGTLPYMSPEQFGGRPDAVDTRTDVYALGVVLFETLAHELPYDLHGKSLHEVARIIRDDPPRRLAALQPGLHGDLETIAAHAIAKDPSRRYSSAADLAADLRRFLRGEPIAARAPDALYLIGKLIARNRGVAIMTALALLLVAAGAVATGWQAVRATRQQNRAESAEAAAISDARRARVEADKAERISSFFRQMLASANPQTARGRDVSVREILDQAAVWVQTDLAGFPEVEAAVRDTIGDTYRSLALYEEAESHLRVAVELRRKTPGIDPLELAASLHNLAAAIHGSGHSNEAYQYAAEALSLRRRLLGEVHAQVAESLHLVGRIAQNTGHHDWAETAYRDELAIRADRLGLRDDGLVYCLSRLGNLLQETYRFAEAEERQIEALALARELHGDEHPVTAVVGTNVGHLLTGVGRYAEAEPVLRAALASARRFWGDDHPDTARLLISLPRALHGLGRDVEAEPLIREGLAAWERKFSRTHRTTAEFMILLADILVAKDGAAGAAEAERTVREGLSVLSERRNWINAQAEGVLGSCLSAQGRYAEAEPLLLASYAELKAARGIRHRDTREAIERIVQLYTAWGKPEAAQEYEAKLPGPASSP